MPGMLRKAAASAIRKNSENEALDSMPSEGLTARKARHVAQSHTNARVVPDEVIQDPSKVSGKRTRTGRRLLDKVVIPPMTPSLPTTRSQAASSSTASRTSGGSTRDNSISNSTRNTSIANTPADDFGSFQIGKASLKLGPNYITTSHKRKVYREEGLQEVKNDEELAMRLQEEEYGVEEAFESDQDGEGNNRIIPDSGDESDEEPLMKKRHANTFEAESDSDDRPLSKRAKPSVKPLKSLRRASKKANYKLSRTDAGDEDESEFEPEDEELPEPRRGSTSSLTSLGSSASTPASDPSSVPRRASAVLAKPRVRTRYRPRLAELRRRRLDPYDRKAARRSKLEKAHPEIRTMWKELEKVPIIQPVEAPQPKEITRRLKPFQLQGLDWMIKQERSHYKGGLLGDEMGMGKTIQAVSLIMSDFPAKDPSLVLVPPVALMQWANEIKDYTDGKLKVLIIHNTNAKAKNLTPKMIRDHNVVIMSYNSLESIFRKQEKGWSRGDEIVQQKSPIHALKFHRIILDEAHSIKSRNTGVAKACFALDAEYKWCLSGTPVQNRIGEFFSLLRFLEVRPFADYFCERCKCAQLHWSVGDDYMCKECKHSAAEHRSVFNEELLNPITGESMELRSEALDKLHMITARVMLRRVKKDYTSSMELPPKEVVIHNEFFGEIERDFSSSIMANTTRKFDTYVAQGVMLNNYANIFGLIMQMRQVANHPDLITRKSAEGGQNVLVCSICDEPAEEPVKSRCQGNKCSFCRSCVKSYIQTCDASGSEADCPRCHVPLSVDWEQPEIVQEEDAVKKSSIINRINMADWTSSTKIEMLVYDLYKLRSKKQTLKSIVFSQFTSMLQLVEWRLRRAGFNTVMLDGSMTPAQRQRSIEYFMNNADVEVFLVSLKAGGVALNLTEASRVFIIDPWWNPAAEWQSADRCHRIGQTRPCVITRLVIEDSVESRMVMLQEKKASMISGTINNDKVAMDKLSPEDLQFLFRGT